MTARPPSMDDGLAAAYMETMPRAMWDYPIDVVRGACANWRRVPSHGKWWPTEQDLRIQCEKLFEPRRKLRAQAMRLLEAFEDEEERADRARQPSYFPGDKHKVFRDEMRKRFTPARYDAYFHPCDIKYVGEDLILTRTEIGASVMNQEGRDLIERMKLRVLYCPVTFARERPRPWADPTDEERADITRKLKRLFEAMAKGEDIKRLRKEGVL